MAAFKIGKMILRSLFGQPATLMYPVKPAKITDATRGHMTIEIDNCIFCGMCQKKCPTNAITVDREAGTWQIARMQCIQCNACAVACKKDALHMDPHYTAPSSEKIVDLVQGVSPKAKKAAEAAKAAEAPVEAPVEAPAEA